MADEWNNANIESKPSLIVSHITGRNKVRLTKVWTKSALPAYKGLNKVRLTGVYHLQPERSRDGSPIYRRIGTSNTWLSFAKGVWRFTEDTDIGRGDIDSEVGFMYGTAKGRQALTPGTLPDGVGEWYTWEYDIWRLREEATVSLVSEDEEPSKLWEKSRNRAESNTILIVSGATGLNKGRLNGKYQFHEIHKDGFPIYAKEGKSDTWVSFNEDGQWCFSERSDIGKTGGLFMHGTAKDDQALTPGTLPDRVEEWYTWEGEKWTLRKGITVSLLAEEWNEAKIESKPSLILSGAIGLNKVRLNGVYHLQSERRKDGSPIYRKIKSNTWLSFARGVWRFTEDSDIGRGDKDSEVGFMHGTAKGRQALMPGTLPEGVAEWYTWEYGKWTPREEAMVSLVTEDEEPGKLWERSRNRAESNTTLIVSGATGLNKVRLNGKYQFHEIHKDGFPIYAKEGKSNTWVYFADGWWCFSERSNIGKTGGLFMHGAAKDDHDLTPGTLPDRVEEWYTWEGEKWALRKGITVSLLAEGAGLEDEQMPKSEEQAHQDNSDDGKGKVGEPCEANANKGKHKSSEGGDEETHDSAKGKHTGSEGGHEEPEEAKEPDKAFSRLSVKELKQKLQDRAITIPAGVAEKKELVELLKSHKLPEKPKTMDEAELWTYTPVNGSMIRPRDVPEIEGKQTGKTLSPGDTFRVIEEKKVGAVTFLRLAGGKGWLFDTKPNVGLMCTKARAQEATPEQAARARPEETKPKAKRARLEEEAQAKAKKEAEETAKKEAEAKLKNEAEEKAKQEAEAKAKKEAEENAKKEAEAKSKRPAEEKAKTEAEAKAKKEAEAIAKKEAEAKSKKEAEKKAKKEAEAKAKKEADETAKKEAEAKSKKKAEEKAKQEAEAKANKEAEENAKKEAEAKLKNETEEKAKQEAEAKAKKESEENAKKEAEAKLKNETEEKAKKEAEAKAKKEAEDNAKKEAEAKSKRPAEEKAKTEAEANAKESRALLNYEQFHNLPKGTATVDQVTNSSAGIAGWAAMQADGHAPARKPDGEPVHEEPQVTKSVEQARQADGQPLHKKLRHSGGDLEQARYKDLFKDEATIHKSGDDIEVVANAVAEAVKMCLEGWAGSLGGIFEQFTADARNSVAHWGWGVEGMSNEKIFMKYDRGDGDMLRAFVMCKMTKAESRKMMKVGQSSVSHYSFTVRLLIWRVVPLNQAASDQVTELMAREGSDVVQQISELGIFRKKPDTPWRCIIS